MKHHPRLIFDEMEHEVIYHAALYALGNETTFDAIATYFDIADDELSKLHKKLLRYIREED